MHVFSLVLPKYIRKYKIPYKILKLEQETEHLHHILNVFEERNANIKNLGKRYLTMLKLYSNGQSTNNSMFIPVRNDKRILV